MEQPQSSNGTSLAAKLVAELHAKRPDLAAPAANAQPARRKGSAAVILIEKPKLRFLDAGRALTIPHPAPHRYKRDRTYALGTTHNRTVRRVEILEVRLDAIRIRIAPYREPPRLLAARSQYGYTDNPAQAMFDEPEAIRPADQHRLATEAQARYAQQRAAQLAQQQARSIQIRLKEAVRRNDTIAYKQLSHELGALGNVGTA